MIVQALREILLDDASVVAVFGDRIYPVELPDAPDYPAAVITKVSGREEYTLAGRVGKEFSRLQVDVFAEGYADMVVGKNTIKDRLSGFSGRPPGGNPCAIDTCKVITDADHPNPQTERAGPRLRSRLLEFTIWHKEL